MMLKRQRRLIIAILTVGLAGVRAHAESDPNPLGTTAPAGAVYVATNDADRNTVLAFSRAANGELTFLRMYATGGRGAGGAVDPLQSQHSLLLSADHKWLFATNAGSGTISIFKIGSRGTLELVAQEPCGGGFPVSLALHGDLLYVLNAGGAGNVTGFRVRSNGRLLPISGATHLLTSASAGGASIDFSPDGGALAATERLNNVIDTFTIGPDGNIVAATTTPSHGNVPFALTFTPQGVLVVAEAAGNPAGGSAVSSYLLNGDDSLTVSSASAPTGYKAACWIETGLNGKYAFVANAASSEISTIQIGNDGELTVLGAAPTGAGTIPLDMAVTSQGPFLYALTTGKGTITGFRIHSDGSLTAVGVVGALPAASGENGLVAF